jgi:enoyl-CoA hydratase/carnithine racemase
MLSAAKHPVETPQSFSNWIKTVQFSALQSPALNANQGVTRKLTPIRRGCAVPGRCPRGCHHTEETLPMNAMKKPLTEKMIAEKDGPIGWITFNNPARHNAVSMSMWEGLEEIVNDYLADDAIRVIVLRGAGDKAFVSGADISEFEEKRSSSEGVRLYNEATDRASEALRNANKPTIAMINGYCIGGGVSIAMSCDMRIAAENSKFGVPAAKLGLGYAAGGIKKLIDVVGPSFAKEIFFTARQFTAPEALAMGLVNRVVPNGQLESYVREYAGTIGQNAPLTIGAVKTIIGELLKPETKRDMKLCQDVVDRCFASQDYTEGRTAFMEKRKPLFKGR